MLVQASKEEVVQSLREQGKGAKKTSSQYRGVSKHQKGKWEARIGKMVGRKWLALHLPHYAYHSCSSVHSLSK